MKILQVCTKVPFPPKDGGAACVFMFSKTLARLGHQVAILAVNPPKHYVKIDEVKLLPERVQLYGVDMDTSVNFSDLIKNLILKKTPYQIDRFADQTFANQFLVHLERFQPEIVQLEGLYLCPYIPLIRSKSKAKIVLREHNVEYILWERIASNQKNVFKRIYLNLQAARLKRYEADQLQKVDAVVALTVDDCNVLQQLNPQVKVKVNPFGIEVSEVSPKGHPVQNIAFIGALDWMPNQEAIQWFVESVWPKVHGRFPELTFHIAGRNAPENLAAFFNSSKNVVFHGEIEDAVDFLERNKVLVVPLFAGSGIRVKIIEAMGQGLVVIASAKAVAGIPAINGKHLLIADSVDDFVDAIDRIITGGELLSQISENALGFVREKFDILAISSELSEFYNETIHG